MHYILATLWTLSFIECCIFLPFPAYAATHIVLLIITLAHWIVGKDLLKHMGVAK